MNEIGNARHELTSMIAIESVRKGAEANIDISIAALDEHYGLSALVKRCAMLLVERLNADSVDANRAVSRIQFFLVFQKQSVLALLDILRGHVTEAYANLRTMIEAALFAALVEKEPKRFMTWLDAGDLGDRAAYETFKREFSTGNAKKLGNHRVAKLLKKYDILSKHTHTSIYHLSRSLRIARTEGSEEFRFRVFEFDPNDPTELRRNWLYAIEANIEIFDLYTSWLPQTSTSRDWDEAFDDLKREFVIAESIWQTAGEKLAERG